MINLEEFISDRPDVLYAAFASCQGKWPKDTDEAYNHVKECRWCQRWLEEHEKLDELISLSPRDKKELRKELKGLLEK